MNTDTGEIRELTTAEEDLQELWLTLTPEQKAAMKKALVTVHKENESRVGKDTLAAVYKETGFKP